MELNDKYLVLLRRELTRAQARLKRAEQERDRLLRQNGRLMEEMARGRARANPPPSRSARSKPR